jgi:hypothetical protein
MALHAQMQGFDAGDRQKRVHRRQGRTEIPQGHSASLGREREVTEVLVEFEPVIGRLGLGQGRKTVALRPVEAAGFDDDAAKRMAMAAQELGRRMADDVGAPGEWFAEIGGRQGVVDDQRNAGLVGDRRHTFEIDDDAAGIGEVLEKDRLGARGQRFAEILRVGRVDKMALPAELFE